MLRDGEELQVWEHRFGPLRRYAVLREPRRVFPYHRSWVSEFRFVGGTGRLWRLLEPTQDAESARLVAAAELGVLGYAPRGTIIFDRNKILGQECAKAAAENPSQASCRSGRCPPRKRLHSDPENVLSPDPPSS